MTSIIKVDNIQSSGGTDAISVDTSGVVYMPNRPSLLLLPNHNGTTAYNSTTISNWRERVNIGFTHSNGVIDIPKTGLYYISIAFIANQTGGIYYRVNGVSQWRATYGDMGTGENWSLQSASYIDNLTEGDDIRFVTEGNQNIYGATNASTIGHLSVTFVG